MSTTFMSASKLLLTSESVTEGHPDKVCDQISDGVLDAIYAKDPMARVACETAATTGFIAVLGEITTTAYFDAQAAPRETLRKIGYTDSKYCLDYKTAGIIVSIKEQSPDIAQGVNDALEVRGGGDDDPIDKIGAGDQGMMIGFACNETPEYMPMPISLAHKLTRQLSQVRRRSWGGIGPMSYLRPDGKSQVTIQYEYGRPVRVETIVISTQHADYIDQEQVRQDVIDHIIKPIIPTHLFDSNTRIFVNPTGRFVTGGPMGDAGLTGRKIIVDTYGGIARHGGGAFSGKDATKVDRSAAYMARYVAKNVVAAGLADRFELQVSYAIGIAHPLSLAVETFGTGKVDDAVIEKLIRKHFDLRPAAIIRDLDLRKPVFQQVAKYGHFGRDDLGVTWERTDKADILRAEAGL